MNDIDRKNCPIMRALKVIGDPWSPLILRELFLQEPRRFRDLEELLAVSPNTLSARLKKLEQAQVVERQMYSSHPPRAEYVLTEKGRALAPVIEALYSWGEAHTPEIVPRP